MFDDIKKADFDVINGQLIVHTENKITVFDNAFEHCQDELNFIIERLRELDKDVDKLE